MGYSWHPLNDAHGKVAYANWSLLKRLLTINTSIDLARLSSSIIVPSPIALSNFDKWLLISPRLQNPVT